MVKQTAVEYLMEQLKFTNKEAYAELHSNGEFEKAQQMFKEQTMDAYEEGEENCDGQSRYIIDYNGKETYYSKTYSK